MELCINRDANIYSVSETSKTSERKREQVTKEREGRENESREGRGIPRGISQLYGCEANILFI
jgi:hypothetical protein